MSLQPIATIAPPASLGDPGRARARFDELVSLGKQAVLAGRIWARIGELAVQMERDQDYAALGYDSMASCIMGIELLSGYDRSSIYVFKRLFEEASPNAGEAIFEMSVGAAQLYRQLPAALQRDEEVQAAARLKPKQFREIVANEYPQALVETKVRLSLNLDFSLYEKWESFLRNCRERNGEDTTYEQALEELLANAELLGN